MISSKNLKILLAALAFTSLSVTRVFASPISIDKQNVITQETQGEVDLLASTSISGWTSGTITNVTITSNDTKYNNSYLVTQIKKDSFSAKFTLYSSTGELFSSYPKSVRTLYGSAVADSASTSGSKTSVTYSYISSAGDYEADVTVSYNIN